jgi:segregation and condensation protein A
MNLTLPALEVQIDCYEGPLAVLISLIKKNKVSIWDIPLSDITERFLQYVELVSEMHLRIAEDFIEIASLLIFIKSRMLLPSDDSGQEDDPGEELVGRIIEYERLRRMSEAIEALPLLHHDTFSRGGSWSEMRTEYDLLCLCTTFFELMKSKEERYIEIKEIKPTLEEKLRLLKAVLEASGFYVWDMRGQENQSDKIATVLGILELTKVKLATVSQRKLFGKITVRKR